MTARRTCNRLAARAITPMFVATFSTAGCASYVPGGTEDTYPDESRSGKPGVFLTLPNRATSDAGAPNGGDPSTQKPPNAGPAAAQMPATMTPQQNTCLPATQRAEAALTTYCSGCHGGASSAQGGFDTVLDVSAMLSSGKVVKNQPDMSMLYKRMSAGTMPPADVPRRPADADIVAVKDWIACGAPDFEEAPARAVAFVDIDSRLNLVLEDLRAISNPVDRQRIRYIDLTTLSNAGASQAELQVYRETVSFLMNSLSRGSTVVAPQAIDDDDLLYRVDLRDYLWDETTWNQLEDVYPYAVIYDQDSRLFPYDEATAEQIREETNTQIPVIQGDWFISHASRPPLYHTLLDLPATLAELEIDLGVRIQRNIDTEQVLRAGFANAGPSQNNRVIERHVLDGNVGALWISYDFANNLEARNIFANPLDFQEDGSELIFNLDNGLQAYFIVNAVGRRLDKAPTDVVQDPMSRDGAVENGLSCMNCHQQDGALPKYDEIRDFQLTAGANAQEIEDALGIYATQDDLQAAFDEDQNRYRTARGALDIEMVGTTTMHGLDNEHLGLIDIDGVASVVGIEKDALESAIDASPQAFPPEIVTLRTKGGGVQRDAFDAVVGELVEALGLGEQLLVGAGSASTSSSSGSAQPVPPSPYPPFPRSQPPQPEAPQP